MILTALIISANWMGQPTVMAIIPFPTRAECEAAVNPVYDATVGAFPDVSLQCVDSQGLASSEIPKWRSK